MKRAPTTFETTVRAFRDLTAAPAEGAATRARVLARASRETGGRVTVGRTSLAVTAALVAVCSAAVAWTTGAQSWRAPAPIVLVEMPSTSRSGGAGAPVGERPRRVIPFASDESAASSEHAQSEASAYGRAHRAHFAADAPARALAAWDDYLAAYPRGVFAPEARYNRALCLVRLGRLGEAARALRAFGLDSPAGYRRTEARLLLDWVQDRLAAERAAAASSGPR